MNMKTVFAAAVFAVSVGFGCDDGSGSSSRTDPDKQSLSTPMTTANSIASDSSQSNSAAASEDNFWANAAQSGLAEVEMGKLAAEKSGNAEVKKFAELMVADHGKANAQLRTVAAIQGVPLPTTLSLDAQSQIGRLRNLSGAEFDRAYADAMVAAHEKDVAAFKEKSQTAEQPELKDFTTKTLPTLQKHLEMIKSIQSKLK